MQVSSIDQYYYLSGSLNTQAGQSSVQAQNQADGSTNDSADISAKALELGKLPPPPHEMDFSSLSDDGLRDYLSQMYDVTGHVPGAEDGVTAEELTSGQLAQARSALIDMSQQPPPDMRLTPESVSSMPDEDLKTVLMMLAGMGGSILGTNGSEDADADSLFGGDLGMIRDQLVQYLAENIFQQNAVSGRAASVYEENSTDNIYEKYSSI